MVISIDGYKLFIGRVYVVSIHGGNIVFFLVFHYTNDTGVIVIGYLDFE